MPSVRIQWWGWRSIQERSPGSTVAAVGGILVRLVIMKRTPKTRQKPAGITRGKAAWQLQTAKARFSELFRRARSEGPQFVTRQGKEAVVVLPVEDFERLSARARQPKSLVQFFAESPLAKAQINLERTKDYGRTIEL